jgi:hypothetical protein
MMIAGRFDRLRTGTPRSYNIAISFLAECHLCAWRKVMHQSIAAESLNFSGSRPPRNRQNPLVLWHFNRYRIFGTAFAKSFSVTGSMTIRHKFERTKASRCVNAQPGAFLFCRTEPDSIFIQQFHFKESAT